MTRYSVALVRADVVEGADVRVGELRDGPRLALEALAHRRRIVDRCAGRTLTATIRSSRVSFAR